MRAKYTQDLSESGFVQRDSSHFSIRSGSLTSPNCMLGPHFSLLSEEQAC